MRRCGRSHSEWFGPPGKHLGEETTVDCGQDRRRQTTSSTGRSTQATASLHIQAPLSQAGPSYTALDKGHGAPSSPLPPRCEPRAAALPGDPGGVNEMMEVKAQHHAGVPHRAEHTRRQSKGKGCQLATIGKCLRQFSGTLEMGR